MPLDKIKILATIILVLFSTNAIGEEVTLSDRLRLWGDCQPFFFNIDFNEQNSTFDQPIEEIEIVVRSRLRSARLYTELDEGMRLIVSIRTVRSAFHISFKFQKLFRDDTISDRYLLPVTTWEAGTLGVHANDSNRILQEVSWHIDQFIDEYLRVNADSC